METISLSKVKIFYDQNHQPREVLMNYDMFEKIAQLVHSEPMPADQSYFWTQSWQSRIREAEADIEAGRKEIASDETIDSVLEWLDE